MNIDNKQHVEKTDNSNNSYDLEKLIKIGTWSIGSISIFLSIFLIAQTFTIAKGKTNDEDFKNTITVSGEGEIMVIPDTATFSYTVSEVAKDVTTAQNLVTEKNNGILDLLKKEGVEKKYIKTKNYNIYPKYEWQTEACIIGELCRGGKNVLLGQEVSQTIEVIVREMDKAGKILSLVGREEVTDLSGLSFKIEDEDAVKDLARSMAIKNAKEKAKELSKELGVKLKKIVGFNEEIGASYPIRAGVYNMSGMMAKEDMATPEIPVGENEVKIRVSVTYEIRD